MKVIKMIQEGSVPMEKGYQGPMPEWEGDEKMEKGKFKPTKEFVEGMVEHFKKGGKVPKRIAWEIVLGCKEVLEKESSLVEVEVQNGLHCDIVGDTHGVSFGSFMVTFRLNNHLLISSCFTLLIFFSHSNFTTSVTCSPLSNPPRKIT